jgi:hypothetical protein
VQHSDAEDMVRHEASEHESDNEAEIVLEDDFTGSSDDEGVSLDQVKLLISSGVCG